MAFTAEYKYVILNRYSAPINKITRDTQKYTRAIKIAQAKTVVRDQQSFSASNQLTKQSSLAPKGRFAELKNRIGSLVNSGVSEQSDKLQSQVAVMQEFNSQFAHFDSDAPPCDLCGSLTVRNGTCYKCCNCGNSMGCS